MSARLSQALLLALAGSVRSQPTIAFPINSQLPPVARIDDLFSYSFSSHTFRSDDNSNITYSLGDHPSWISLDSDSRLLLGTPTDGQVPPGDVVGQTLELIATDDSGSASLNATLVVTRDAGPQVQIPISEQIQKFGNYSAPSSVLCYPSAPFKFSFDPQTFGPSDGINYYAVSQNSSPLPAWIKFDASTLTFSGQTPAVESLIQPPQSFSFELVASDIVGFSAVSVPFSLVVGSHKLTTDRPVVSLHTSRGSPLSYNGLQDSINLDGKPVKPGDIKVTTNNVPSWVNFDATTWEIRGTPDKSAHSVNFTIDFQDTFSDSLSVLVAVDVASGLFKSTFQDMDIDAGKNFDLDISTYLRDPSDVTVTVTTDPTEPWLKVDGFKISGKVPMKAKGSLQITVNAASKSSNLKDTEKLTVNFINPKIAATATSSSASFKTSSTTSSTSGSTTTHDSDGSHGHHHHLETSYILLAVLIPILFIILCVMLFVCFCRRRRQKRTYLNSTYRSKISKPILSSLRINDSAATFRPTNEQLSLGFITETEKMFPEKRAFAQTTSRAPSSSDSSHTMGDFSNHTAPHDLMAVGGAAPAPLSFKSPFAMPQTRGHSNSDPTSNGRQSWMTVEGSVTTHNAHSDGSRSMSAGHHRYQSDSQRTDTTFPESQHILLPTPSFFDVNKTFRDGLNLAMPTRNSIQPTPDGAYEPPPKSPRRPPSTTTTSSEALPLSKMTSHRLPRRMGEPATSTIKEDEASEAAAVAAAAVPSTPKPARLSSQQWLTKRAEASGSIGNWYEDSRASFRSETSFGSSENWRIIGERSPVRGSPMRESPLKGPMGLSSRSYKDLVEEVEFHPARASNDNRGGQGSSSAEAGARRLVEPEKRAGEGWGGSLLKLSQSVSAGFTESHKSSEGSFKVFL